MTVDVKIYRLENGECQSRQTTVDIKVYTWITKVETLQRTLRNTQWMLN